MRKFIPLLSMLLLPWISSAAIDERSPLPEGNVPDAVELAVLQDIYTTLGGSSWPLATNWPSSWPATATSANYGTWYGITVTNNDITKIELNQNGLSGTIPASIGNLTELTYLNLNVNSLSGAIPTSIGNLTKLTYLNLCCNQLTSIPDEIGDLTALKSLFLYANQINDVIPTTIGDLTNLEDLYFGGNQFHGSIPTEIGSLTSLKYLILNNNSLTGSIPSTIGNLTHLIKLDLKVNGLTGDIPSSIGNLTSLTDLDICCNQLTSIPTTIGNLSSLHLLYLYGNKITSLPSEIGNATALVSMILDHNEMTGSIPSTIGNLTSLTTLSLSENRFSGSIPSSIGNLTALTSLSLQVNLLEGPIPTSIGNLTNLTNLLLCCNKFTNFPSQIGNLTALNTLNMYGNQIEGTIPTSIGNLVNLKSFFIDNNKLTGNLPTQLSNLTQLENFSFSENEITGTMPDIGTFREVYFQNNRLTFSGFLTALSHFDGAVAFQYWNQKKADVEKDVHAQVGGTLTLTTSVDRSTTPASVYQWFKKVGGVTTALNAASTTGHTVSIPNIQSSDNGTQYYYTITNPAATNLTLTSNLQTLETTVCDVPAVTFATTVDAYTYTFTPTVNNAGSCTTSYLWDFGDGQTSPDATSSHVFNTTGTYLVSLTLSYKCGECDSTAVVVQDTVEVSNTSICTAIYCDGYGNVGIGTMRTQGFRLSVDGKIRASEIIKVYPQGQWSDFVFEDKYRLRPLSEVESFIKKNGHLPDIPSAKEVEKEGVELGSMDAKLLQKIEELTLYMIESKKKTDELEVKLETVIKENERLKEQVTKSKKSRQ